MIKQEELIPFYRDIEGLEIRKKDIGANIKDALTEFAKKYDVSVKSIKADYKKWKEYQKNSDEFVEVDLEVDALTQTWCREYQDRDREAA